MYRAEGDSAAILHATNDCCELRGVVSLLACDGAAESHLHAEIVVKVKTPTSAAVFEGAVREYVRARSVTIVLLDVVGDDVVRNRVELVNLPVDESFGSGQFVELAQEFEVFAQEGLVLRYAAGNGEVADARAVA